jgi:hypothetical protein
MIGGYGDRIGRLYRRICVTSAYFDELRGKIHGNLPKFSLNRNAGAALGRSPYAEGSPRYSASAQKVSIQNQ